jgi:hypothetical protein
MNQYEDLFMYAQWQGIELENVFLTLEFAFSLFYFSVNSGFAINGVKDFFGGGEDI